MTDGLRTTRPSSGQDQEVGDAEALSFHEGFSLSLSQTLSQQQGGAGHD